MAEQQRLDYIPVTFTLGGSGGLDRQSRFVGNQTWLNGPLTLIGPRGEIQGPGGSYLKSTGTDPANATIELRLTGAADDSKVQLTQSTLTLEGGTTVSIVANDSGTVTIGSKTRVADDDEPSLSSTNHAFQVGTPGTSAGDLQMKFGPANIQATEGDLSSVLKLNNFGGPVLANNRQVTPLGGVSTALAGTAPAVSSTTAQYFMQAGKVTVTASAGAASWSFPTLFPTGLLALVASAAGAAFADFGLFVDSTSTASTGKVFAVSAGAAYSGSLSVSYVAIGW